MAARRCSRCSINWPTEGPILCAVCKEATSYMPNAAPIAEEEARSLRSHSDFEDKLLAEHPAQRRMRQQKYEAKQAERLARLAGWEALVAQLQD